MAEIVPAKRTLDECEAVIRQGLGTFMDVAAALTEIRDRKLYMDGHGGYVTFNVYCEKVWNFTANYARRILAAGEVAKALPPSVPIGTLSESQVRPLTKIKDDKPAVRKAWKRAAKTAQAEGRATPTAAHVEAAVAQVAPAKPRITAVKTDDADALLRKLVAMPTPDLARGQRTLLSAGMKKLRLAAIAKDAK